MKTISSRHNPVVRAFRDLADQPDARGARLLLDGAHLIREAAAAGLSFELVAVETSQSERGTEAGLLAAALADRGVEVATVTSAVLDAISPVRHPSGIAGIAVRQPSSVHAILTPTDAFVLTICDVQDPGNVGALLRVGEAAGATGALVGGASANPFSWKALRGAMGSSLRLPTVSGLTVEAAIAQMREAGVRTVASVARGGADPDDADWTGKVAVVVGGEGPGLTDAIVDACDARVTIPMQPPVESLNVAVAAAILLYAARRQRV